MSKISANFFFKFKSGLAKWRLWKNYKKRIKTDGFNFRAMGILSLYIMTTTDGSLYFRRGRCSATLRSRGRGVPWDHGIGRFTITIGIIILITTMIIIIIFLFIIIIIIHNHGIGWFTITIGIIFIIKVSQSQLS